MTLPLRCCIFSCLEIPSNFVKGSEDCIVPILCSIPPTMAVVWKQWALTRCLICGVRVTWFIFSPWKAEGGCSPQVSILGTRPQLFFHCRRGSLRVGAAVRLPVPLYFRLSPAARLQAQVQFSCENQDGYSHGNSVHQAQGQSPAQFQGPCSSCKCAVAGSIKQRHL